MTNDEFYTKHYAKIAFSTTLTNIARNRSGFGSLERFMVALMGFLRATDGRQGTRISRGKARYLSVRLGAPEPLKFVLALNWLGYLRDAQRYYIIEHASTVIDHPHIAEPPPKSSDEAYARVMAAVHSLGELSLKRLGAVHHA